MELSFTLGNQSVEALMQGIRMSEFCAKRLPALISREASGPPLEKKGGFYRMTTQFNKGTASSAVSNQGLRLGTAAEALAYLKAGHPRPKYWVAMGNEDQAGRFLCWTSDRAGFKLSHYWIWAKECALFVVTN